MSTVKAVTLACVALLFAVTPGRAEKPDARDSAKIQSCIKSATGGPREQERCIGIIADPCLESENAKSTADQVACAAREHQLSHFGACGGLTTRPSGRLSAAIAAMSASLSLKSNTATSAAR